jgi:hypothetical protein
VIDLDNLVDPLGYPFTTMDYLRVLDSYFAGLGAYDYVAETRDCVSTTQDYLPGLNETYNAWNFLDFENPENHTLIFNESIPDIIYNATETISQEFTPIYRYCAKSSYIGFDMWWTKQQ